MFKRIICALLALVLTLAFVGCDRDATFTCAELSLTLSKDYREVESGGESNMVLTDGKSTVSFKRLSLSDAEKNGISPSYSDSQFAEFFLINSGIDGTIANYADTPYYTYYDETGSERLFCLAAFYRTPYAFFIVIFASSASRESDAREEYFEILETATYMIVD